MPIPAKFILNPQKGGIISMLLCRSFANQFIPCQRELKIEASTRHSNFDMQSKARRSNKKKSHELETKNQGKVFATDSGLHYEKLIDGDIRLG